MATANTFTAVEPILQKFIAFPLARFAAHDSNPTAAYRREADVLERAEPPALCEQRCYLV
jgi:hypothetical protein